MSITDPGLPLGGATTSSRASQENLRVVETVSARITPLYLTLGETLHVSESATVTRTLSVAVDGETLHVSEAADVAMQLFAVRPRRSMSPSRRPSRATSRGR